MSTPIILLPDLRVREQAVKSVWSLIIYSLNRVFSPFIINITHSNNNVITAVIIQFNERNQSRYIHT